MSRNPRLNRPDLTAWQSETIRVTAFPSSDAVVTSETWWKALLGEEPSLQTVRKGRFFRRDQGDALNGVMSLTVQPGRIDWNLGPKVVPDEPPQDFPSLGTAVDNIRRFTDLILHWLPSSPPLDRLAMGVTAWLPAKDQHEAYSILDTLLPAVEVDPASSDFRYQVNRARPTRLGIEGLRINRLMTWSAIRMEIVAFAGGGGRSYRSSPIFSVRAELDINTSPDFAGPLDPGALPNLLLEFQDDSFEILQGGDQP